MYNKKVLSEAISKLNAAKAPKQKPDILYTEEGQWKYPGETTRIPSDTITMDGVPYPVMAYPNIGEPVLMQPGEQHYFPEADYVDEYPEMKRGGSKGLPRRKTKSLSGINKLLAKNPLLRSYKHKLFDPTHNKFQDGGFIDLELTDEEIKEYRKGGYIVEELPQAQSGLVSQFLERAKNVSKTKVANEKKPKLVIPEKSENYFFPTSLDSAHFSESTYTVPAVAASEKKIKDIFWDEVDKAVVEREYNKLNTEDKYLSSINDYEKKEQENILNNMILEFENADSEKIKTLQKTLLSENYDLGKYGVDGKFGNKTKNALISKFKNETLNPSLIDKYYKKFNPENENSVKKIQQKLFEEGYLKGNPLEEIDGKFGDKTKEAFEKYNTSKNPDAFFFTNIPNKINIDECAKGMCSILEMNDVRTEALGVKYKNAWDIFENMNKHKNSTPVYNIYDDERFKNIKTKEELVNTTKKIKKESQTTPEMYKAGDIIGIFREGSDFHTTTLNSKTHNTHTGFVSSIKDGIPMITHNVHGTVKTEPFSNVTTTWIQRPNKEIKFDKKYKPEVQEKNTDELIKNYEKRFNAKISPERKKELTKIINTVYTDAQTLPDLLNSEVDKEWLESAVIGITGVETGIGKTVDKTAEDKDLKNKIGYLIKDVKDEDISLGISKTKFNSLDNFAKNYFDIKDVKDLGNNEKLLHVTTYNLIKYHDVFKDYALQFPELELTEQDIRDMSILAHNRGDKKLLTIGRRSDNPKDPNFYSDSQGLDYKEEVARLRDITRRGATQNDVSTTLWRFAPNLITDNMNFENETYVSKVKNYQKSLFNKDYQTGGFIELELTPEEIEWYKSQGYNVEELD
jgi:hypothetical protein